MRTRLTKLRSILTDRNADLQRLYNFRFYSLKLKLFNIDTQIVSINHPQLQFQNIGDYKGYINAVTKPGEITIGFVEDSKQTVNAVFDLWDNLKFDKFTGIHYPKALYEDNAWLIYNGPFSKPKLIGDAEGRETQETKSEVGNFFLNTFNVTKFKQETRRYTLSGLYPIQRESVSLGYDNNSIEVLNVTFNVDGIKSNFTLAPVTGTVESISDSFSSSLGV